MRSDAPPPPDKRVRAQAASEATPGVLAFVTDEYAVALRNLLDQRWHVTRVPDLTRLQITSLPSCDALLLEWREVVRCFPRIRDREAHIWRAVRRMPAPVMILADLSAGDVPPLMELALGRAAGLLLQGVHDIRVEEFARRILEASSAHRVRQLLPSVSALMEIAPEPLRGALAALMHEPACFEDVSDLASATNSTTRTLERKLHALGVSSPRTLLACVRLAHLHVGMVDAAQPRSSMARALGFHSVSALQNAILRIAGCGTISAFLALTSEQLTSRLQAALNGTPKLIR